MFAFTSGVLPDFKSRAVLARAAAAALIAALGGCASTQDAANGASTNMHVAQTVTEVEDDGLPAQTPPSPSIRQLPDDPSQPYSRNYGGANPSAVTGPLVEPKEAQPARAPAPQIPSDLPPAFRKKLATAMAETE